MHCEEMMQAIYRELPDLEGQLDPPRAVYVRSQDKVYLTFTSRSLVDEQAFLRMERILQRLFPRNRLALRVVSPELGQAFLKDIGAYSQVLVDFLRRNYPASASWAKEISWRAQKNLVTLTFPNQFAMDYMARNQVQERMHQAIRDIFALDCRVELEVDGDQEKRLEELRRERERILQKAYTTRELEDMARKAEGTERTESAKKKPRGGENPQGKPVLGRSIADRPVPMRELTAESGLVVVQGDIFKLESRELRGGETLLLIFAVTDYTSSIVCKSFLHYRKGFGRKGGEPETPITPEERRAVMEKVEALKVGMNVRVRGECTFDTFSRELCVTVRDLVPMDKQERRDESPEKRVELHMHTQMSAMDALASAEDLVARAAAWGHPAVAITDHGVLQAFPAAFRAAKGKIKLIPGCEGYLIQDPPVVRNATDRKSGESIVVLDFESTGLNTRVCRVIEIGAVRLRAGRVEDTLSLLVNPHTPLPPEVVKLTGITDSMLADQEDAASAIPKLMEFIGDCPVAAHNAAFDVSLLQAELKRLDRSWEGPVLDTLILSRKLYPDMKSHRLGSVCKALGVSLKNAHRAVHDAAATAECLARMLETCGDRGLETLQDLNTLRGVAIGESYHIILLARNQTGLVNLNRLVSLSHLEHFRRRPHMPREEIQKYREGLLLGSACEAGELFQALLKDEPWEVLREIASFYDYLEIQPTGNNEFLIRNGTVDSEEDLRELNRKILRLGQEMGKPVVATGDVHFMDPHHALNRAIIQAGMGYEDCDEQPPLYFKTTQEMLQDFAYLGKTLSHEVVIDNPRRIADMVDPDIRLFPKHPKGEDTFQPLWAEAADAIQDMTWSMAREMYGENLPGIVRARLEKELKSIVGYGYCTLYNIAQKLVSKSLEDGYLVGSRGSVGSSLVARMCGITEVNALPPHYRCVSCHRGFFDVDRTKYHVGVDLPDRACPLCGQKLTKDGFDIPFEVFLGFEGDKVPDIDLNFSGEYQNKAHHYVEELFGRDHVFRAGTISALADKTAYGFVSKYMEERNIQCGNTEKDRLAQGCVGVKRTTGQHPGGMVVVPMEYEICQFTAVQHPADDLESDFTTTHYDFNSMHDILVKLDCLGHDDPTMMHMLEELTGINFKDVPLDDWGVRSLFHSPEALGVTEEDILCNTGTYGVPEFGTGFVRGMLQETQPSTMEELLRISGLSHGTDVWLGNAQDLIRAGTATLSECVCCRDDIMNYLISKGVAPKMAFTTMESVRKGKGLKPEMEKAMVEADVPEWFMDSCRKIQYMFPKGHAVAYVTMSLRVAWYKLHYPLAYYCAYFTVRGDGFNASTMLMEPDVCRSRLREIRALEKPTARDKETATALEMVLEMTSRGIRFLRVDLYRSEATRFVMENGHLRCPFTSLAGLGESAAMPILEARKKGPFLSVEDLRERAHVGQAVIELLREHGALEGLSETSQMSMF